MTNVTKVLVAALGTALGALFAALTQIDWVALLGGL